MSKLIYIFTRQPLAYGPRRMRIEGEKLGHSVMIIDYKKIAFKFTSNLEVYLENSRLKLPDIAIFRAPWINGPSTSVWNTLFNWCIENDVRVLNGSTYNKFRNFDKLNQHLFFAKNNIPFVETTVYSKKSFIKANHPSFPFIVKSSLGSHGDFVWKINSVEDVSELDINNAPFLVQPMLPGARDVRVIILGQNPIGAMERTAKEGSYLSNFSAGGSVKSFDLSKNSEVFSISKKLADALACEYGGIDLMQDQNGEWKVLEINLFCQFEGFEKSTNINVPLQLISYLIQ